MCGIAGIATWRPTAGLAPLIDTMTGVLAHRGPDGAGAWIDPSAGIGLGHRRLAILDTSDRGNQPMSSQTERFVITYNGAVYNFDGLRRELEAAGLRPAWRGHSDTEVLLACFERWGIERTLPRMIGMFALAIWDREQRTLTLARDRIGEKPLYYGVIANQLIFGSEIQAIRAVVATSLVVDRSAVADLMRLGYIPAPRTIFQNVSKLPAGHYLTMRSVDDVNAIPRAYWNLPASDASLDASLGAQLEKQSDQELLDQLHERIAQAVKLQMVSDVPLGAWLSGGIDSSAVVALMQAQAPRPVRTFTLGFDDGAFDEAPYAKAIARHLGTDHTELYINSRDAADIIPNLPVIYSEPFADSSQIPTSLLSKLTGQRVTVSLSGDGGDELFAGYPRYQLIPALWNGARFTPGFARHAVARMLKLSSASSWDRLLSFLPAGFSNTLNGRRLHTVAQFLDTDGLAGMYARSMSHWQPEDELVYGADGPASNDWPNARTTLEALRRWDVGQYLPDDLLVKTDRAGMSAGLECRSPLLDHRLVEFAFALPKRMLVRNGVGKWALRQILGRYVPHHLTDRRKTGFSVPLAEWLRGPLRDWASDLLAPENIDQYGYLNSGKVAAVWREHLSGKFDRSSRLWNVLMFQGWLKHYKA
jgi:asparagine synthase (glutamine-hydrolysing)